MKTRRTTFVAVLSQTRARSATVTRTSASNAADGVFDCDLKTTPASVATVAAPLGRTVQHWCGECATPMVMVPPELAATVCFQTTRAIYRLVEDGRIHFTDGPEGVMVCPASLMKNWASERTPLLALRES
jgi:hypothetical protein